MKLSSALLVLALGVSAAEARAGARRTTRRAQDDVAAAADVADVADDELTADAAGNGGTSRSPMCPCAEDKVRGLIHLIVPETPDIPEQQYRTDVGVVQGVTTIDEDYYEYPIPTVGGIAIAYNDDQEVEFKSANGSTFDIAACYLEKANKDFPLSILFCPMIPGHALTLEVSDTYYGDCETEPNRGRRKLEGLPDGILVALEIDYGIGCGPVCRDRLRRSLEEQKKRRKLGRNFSTSTPDYFQPPGVTATFQCGRYKCLEEHGGNFEDRGIIEQHTHFLDAYQLASSGPLEGAGTTYSFDLAECDVNPYSVE